jgi:hypothetical protein
VSKRSGVELEDGGGEGTSSSHFEGRLSFEELMASWTSGSALISVFCLSGLDDTGWYMVNCSYSEALMFGDYRSIVGSKQEDFRGFLCRPPGPARLITVCPTRRKTRRACSALTAVLRLDHVSTGFPGDFATKPRSRSVATPSFMAQRTWTIMAAIGLIVRSSCCPTQTGFANRAVTGRWRSDGVGTAGEMRCVRRQRVPGWVWRFERYDWILLQDDLSGELESRYSRWKPDS